MSQYKAELTKQSMWRYLGSGALAGAVSAVLANGAAQIIESITGLKFQELNPLSITLASLIPSLLGSLLFAILHRRTKRANVIFAVIALLLASLDTLNVIAIPPHPRFSVVAGPLHYIVAVTVMLMLPWMLNRRSKLVAASGVSATNS